MKKGIIITIILLVCFTCFAQDKYQNLKKYWYYRERLKNFVLVSQNFDEEGTNLPAERISKDQNTIAWDDGNGAFNQYISVLATEYRLLKNFGQDYSQSIKELYYALKSFERLDKNAESYFREDHTSQGGDLNGFFLRKDVSSNFWNKYKKGGSSPYFKQEILNEIDNPQILDNSLDNCIHFLESFSLVESLVENETVDGSLIDFKQLARDNAVRIIRHMYHPDNPIPLIDIPLYDQLYPYIWYVMNPVNGKEVPLGSGLDGTMMYTSYPFSRAGNHFSQTLDFKAWGINKTIINDLLEYPISTTVLQTKLAMYYRMAVWPVTGAYFLDFELFVIRDNKSHKILDLIHYPAYVNISSKSKIWDILPQDDYKARSLCATTDIEVQDRSPYELLINKQYQDINHPYEHLPLIWSVLSDNFGYITDQDRQFVKNLLDKAPACGPKKIKNDNGFLDYDNFEWSSQNRLVWPERRGVDNMFNGYYNGLDYLLLHNLYWLSNRQYPESLNFRQSAIAGGFFPLNGIATNHVTCFSKVNTTLGNAKLIAGKEITLEPGFSVIPELFHNFSAKITDGMTQGEEPIFYQKIPLDNYPVCSSNLKSKKAKVDVGGEKLLTSDSLLIFPNPCHDRITMKTNKRIQVTKIEIYNETGFLEKSIYNIISTIFDIDVADLSEGVHFMKIQDFQKNTDVFKIVKK